MQVQFFFGRSIIMDKIAYIIDGGFFTKSFEDRYKYLPNADIVEEYIKCVHKYIKNNYINDQVEIYRIFFYDCEPLNYKTYQSYRWIYI